MWNPRPSRRLLAALFGVACLPAASSVGLGWWNPVGAWQQAQVLAATTRLSEVVEAAPPILHGVGIVLPGVVVGLLVWATASRARLIAGTLEVVALLAGAVGAAGLFAVGVGLDRTVFWLGLIVAAAAGRRVWSEEAATGLPPALRGVVAAGGLSVAGLAGLTLLEGPSMHSPAFRLRDVWMAGPGLSPWTSGGVWTLLGAAAFAITRTVPRLRTPHWVLAAAVGVGLLGLFRPAQLGPASALSAAGLVCLGGSVGVGASRWMRDSLHAGAWSPLDPRRLGLFATPLLVWCAVCAMRGLTVGMWTVPAALPPDVTQLADRPDLFSLASDGDQGVLFTDRERDVLGLWTPSGETLWDISGGGVEEVSAPHGGTAWVSVVGEESSGVVAVDLDTGPGAYVEMPDCFVSDWVPQPGSSRVLVPCESNPVARWFDSASGHRTGTLSLAHEVETAVFHPDGDRFFAVGLWHTPSVITYGLPDGDVRGERLVGPFNWALALDAERDRIWVSRFFEGGALVLDASTLEVVERVRLSFGVRAMLYEPVNDRVWAAAAYSGVLWSVSASDPDDRVAYALCGQARDLAASPGGRVFVATDCGLFGIGPD